MPFVLRFQAFMREERRFMREFLECWRALKASRL